MSKILELADAYAEASSKEEGESQRWDSNLRYVAELQLEKNEARAALQAEVEKLEEDSKKYIIHGMELVQERDALRQELKCYSEHMERKLAAAAKDASEHLRTLDMARTALIEHGSPFLHHELRYQEAIHFCNAALGATK